MKASQAALAVSTPNDVGTVATAQKADERAGPQERSLVLASANAWVHTVILTGELDRGSAHLLEAEMERLCKEGVTGITLDLRGLTHIDSIGVAVVAFQCGLCRRRGYDVDLIPGPASVQHAFKDARVLDTLPFREEEIAGSVASPAAS
jgi:anti-anti-sigma factor